MKHWKVILISCILSSFLVNYSYSQELVTSAHYEMNTIGAGSELFVSDPLQIEEALQSALYKVDRRFRVELIYNRNHHTDQIDGLEWQLSIQVKESVSGQIETLLLEFNQEDNGLGIYSGWADFESNDYSMNWRVLSVTPMKKDLGNWIPAVITELPIEDIHMECLVINDRIVELDESVCAGMELEGERLTWQAIRGGVEYDVEWVFIDDLDNFSYSASQPEGPFEFKEAVRITTYKHSHQLDLIYPKGTVYFRIRPRGYFFRSGGHEVYYTGNWCYTTKSGNGNLSWYNSSNYEGKKTWQYSVAFAENGLSKSTIAYYDGTMRARQQVSRMNSTKQVVAAGTVYDHEGRKSVQVIPTPIVTGDLSYFEGLQVDGVGGIFDKNDFDLGTSDPLGTNSGAGRYYSALNDFSGIEPFRDRIPDAEGYAYSQVKFHHDNTGRPNVQSGIGKTHRMGGGHESYFFYVKPTDRNLRELFGSNVGDAVHYDKQIAIDANGQASVSYTDMHGRVIANGLFGESPTNLLPLDNNPSGTQTTETSSLMSSNIISTDTDGNVTSQIDYYHMNIGANQITLDYDLVSGGLVEDNSIFGTGNCVSCMYELIIRVTDPNGVQLDLNYTSQTNGQVYPYVYEKYSGATIDCNSGSFNPALTSISVVQMIDKTGAYHIEKTLRTDAESVSNYIVNNINSLASSPSLSAITSNYLANIVTTGCGIDCAAFYEQECREELGYVVSGTLSVSEQTAVDQCISTKCDAAYAEMNTDIASGDANPCNMLKGMLAIDVSPGGWVFEEDTDWESVSANWMFAYPKSTGGTFTPLSLQNLEDNWEDGWQDLLLASHPEYCHYTKCVDLESINNFSNNILDEQTMSGATSSNFVNGSYQFLSTGDPMFSDPLYSSTAPSWLSSLNSNYEGTGNSIYYYVFNDLFVNNPSMTEDATGNQILPASMSNPVYADLVWSVMRTLYVGQRFEFFESNYIYTGCSGANYTNGYYNHPSANFHDPLSLQTAGTNGGYPDFFMPLDQGCAEVCNSNVLQWMTQIEDECPTLTTAQLETINENLQNYCLTDCDGLFNMTGMIQMSDLIAPANSDLANIESILSSVCGYSLVNIAIDDTCATSTTYTINNATVFGASLQKNLAVLTSTYAFNYGQFITSPAIVTLSNPNVDFNQTWWDNGMQLKLTYNGASTIFDVNNIASVSIVNQDISGIDVIFTVRVVQNNGTTSDHSTDQFSLKKSNNQWQDFTINRVSVKSLTGTICDSIMENPFEYVFDLQAWIDDCIADIEFEATTLAQQEYDNAIDLLNSQLLGAFENQCFNSDLEETFTITYVKQEYAFTLYYYDQANNLVQTVPPQGVHIVPAVNFPLGVWNSTEPNHSMKTMYAYNALGQMLKTKTPDGGSSHFYYNSAQQLRFSQNDYQVTLDEYSYARFDELGRPIEIGVTEIASFAAYFSGYKNDNNYPQSSVSYPNSEVTRTYYEDQPLDLNSTIGWNPKDLNTRIGAVAYYESFDGNQDAYSSASFYDYDIHGNVQKLLNDNPIMGDFQRYKTVDYDYDVFSGKVNEVWFQKSQQDQFAHRYAYDDDNRLVSVETSRDGILWDEDAEYFYYLTGALARVELGDNKVQGIDYAYTINGWIKGVNSNTLEARRDMGEDGATLNKKNKWVAQDAFGFSLTYFNDEASNEVDYTSIAGPTAQDNKWFAVDESAFLPTTGASLYNGNIRAMVTAIRKDDFSLLEPTARVYQYDQLQRIKEAKTYVANTLVSDNSWANGSFTQAYESSYQFDLNGNLTELTRNGSGVDEMGVPISTDMDHFTYYYEDGAGGSTTVPTEVNRLFSVKDNITSSAYSNDIKDGQTATSANYTYDEMGRLTSDVDAEIASITWTVTSKVAYIDRSSSSTLSDVEFKYDALGNRIAKIEYTNDGTGFINKTFYSRDALGKVMSTYSQVGTANIKIMDYELYGASRLGVQEVYEELNATPNFDYCSENNRASAIIEVSSTVFAIGDNVQYKIAGIEIMGPMAISGNFEQDAELIISKINEKTILSDVVASHWWSNNGTEQYFIEITYTQPGNWNGASLDLLLNGALSYSEATSPKRKMGYGSCRGNDIVGIKRYELSNHLENVLVVITDRKWSVDSGVFDANGVQISAIDDGLVDYYEPEVVSYSDYYPYGMLMDNRNGSEDYRYGFNGMEIDNDIKSGGNSYSTQFRMLDVRIGRWLSLDPLMAQYPQHSAYCAFNNNPIYFADPTGLEGEPKIGDTRIEDNVQQVYIGDGDGLGWKSATETENFAGSEGKSVYFRTGEDGAYSYQQINKVVISVDANNSLGAQGYSEQIGTGTSWLIATDDIETARDLFKSKFGDNTVGEILIDSHGRANKKNHAETRPLGEMQTTFGKAAEYVRLSLYGIREAKNGRRIGTTQIEYSDAVAFVDIIKSISKNGVLVISGCSIGKDLDLVKELGWTTAQGVSVYANQDLTQVDLFTDNVSVTTRDALLDKGWVSWGIVNEEKVQSKGAKPRFGFKKLKTDSNNGNLRFNY